MRGKANQKTGKVRIIGGKWRGRRLPVPDIDGLRPSGDRARETLFNWLQAQIRNALCADLFAGTGVLGLEATSRGAAAVVLVEKSPVAARAIRQSLETLDAGNVELIQGDAVGWILNCAEQSLDMVFIDPPFGQGLQQAALSALERGNCLKNGAIVYLETAREESAIVPPPGWSEVKEKVLGEVRMQLLKKN
jgi:16S rRNA (guanine966-N2)-methyltransferase